MANEQRIGYLPDEIRTIAIAESEGMPGTSSSDYIGTYESYRTLQEAGGSAEGILIVGAEQLTQAGTTDSDFLTAPVVRQPSVVNADPYFLLGD